MSNIKIAKEFFSVNLPKNIVDKTNFETLVLEKESFIGDKLKLNISDALFSAKIDDEQSYFYILLLISIE